MEVCGDKMHNKCTQAGLQDKFTLVHLLQAKWVLSKLHQIIIPYYNVYIGLEIMSPLKGGCSAI